MWSKVNEQLPSPVSQSGFFFKQQLGWIIGFFKKLKLKTFYKLVIPCTLFSAPVQTMFDNVSELG